MSESISSETSVTSARLIRDAQPCRHQRIGAGGAGDCLSRWLEVPKNYMFIETPGDHFPHRIADLGGVRLIM